jgi:voltage-gated potassium channel
MDALQSFMRHYDVPAGLQREVYGFFNHQWARKVSQDEQAILSDLPPALQQELQVLLNVRPISRLSLFSGTSKDCLQDVSAALTQVYFSPGQQIIAKGEIGEDMYLIGHGSVNVHVGDQFITSLGPGACFGEMALIADPKRTTDVTAAGYCDVFKLSKKQLDELIIRHSDLKDNVHRLAAERQEKLRQSKSKEKNGQQAS